MAFDVWEKAIANIAAIENEIATERDALLEGCRPSMYLGSAEAVQRYQGMGSHTYEDGHPIPQQKIETAAELAMSALHKTVEQAGSKVYDEIGD
jgi:hypothetical protein